MLVLLAQCTSTFFDLTKWSWQCSKIYLPLHPSALSHGHCRLPIQKRFHLWDHETFSARSRVIACIRWYSWLFTSRILINENPKMLVPRGAPIKMMPGSISCLNSSMPHSSIKNKLTIKRQLTCFFPHFQDSDADCLCSGKLRNHPRNKHHTPLSLNATMGFLSHIYNCMFFVV